jgi:hypothetical protein
VNSEQFGERGDDTNTESRHLQYSLSADAVLYAMGWETANVHLDDGAQTQAVQRDLAARKSTWLRKAAKAMAQATLADWNDWAEHHAE